MAHRPQCCGVDPPRQAFGNIGRRNRVAGIVNHCHSSMPNAMRVGDITGRMTPGAYSAWLPQYQFGSTWRSGRDAPAGEVDMRGGQSIARQFSMHATHAFHRQSRVVSGPRPLVPVEECHIAGRNFGRTRLQRSVAAAIQTRGHASIEQKGGGCQNEQALHRHLSVSFAAANWPLAFRYKIRVTKKVRESPARHCCAVQRHVSSASRLGAPPNRRFVSLPIIFPAATILCASWQTMMTALF